MLISVVGLAHRIAPIHASIFSKLLPNRLESPPLLLVAEVKTNQLKRIVQDRQTAIIFNRLSESS